MTLNYISSKSRSQTDTSQFQIKVISSYRNFESRGCALLKNVFQLGGKLNKKYLENESTLLKRADLKVAMHNRDIVKSGPLPFSICKN